LSRRVKSSPRKKHPRQQQPAHTGSCRSLPKPRQTEAEKTTCPPRVSATTFEADDWFQRRRGFDIEAIANRCRTDRCCDGLGIVLSHLEHPRLGRALEATCRQCELVELGDKPTLWELENIEKMLPARPGAVAPWKNCQGCVHSYTGDLEDTDLSLLSVFAPRPELLTNLIRDRARQIIDTRLRRARR
jgi:hypothetical protein